MKNICKEYSNLEYTAKDLKSIISSAKNNKITAKKMEQDADTVINDILATIYIDYQQALEDNNAIDFDDLLLFTIDLFKDKKILGKWQKRFKYVLVDEFQDTNKPQFEIVRSLVKEHNNLCVVGDDNQAIYGWRGSNIDYIINFSSYFPHVNVHRLEINYRSVPVILEAASAVIENNKNKTKKDIIPFRAGTDDTLIVTRSSNEFKEAENVVDKVMSLLKKGTYSYRDFAVLYRTNMQSRVLEDLFRRNKIPHEVVGGQSFYARKEIKDIIAFLTVLNNPNDDLALSRIINFPPRRMGKTSVDRIKQRSQELNKSMYVACGTLGGKFADFYNTLSSIDTSGGLASVVSAIIDVFNIREHWARDEDDEYRNDNLDELIETADQLEEGYELSLEEFLNDISLATQSSEDDNDRVSLMTAHAAKGLEFKVVFVVGLMDDLFPLPASTAAQLEEERRLFYVALTRAEDKSYLSYSESRYRYNTKEYYYKSSFLSEIPVTCIRSSYDY